MHEKLRIILFPNDFDTSTNNTLGGAFAFSTTEKIFINKTDDFYHINYRFNDYLKLDMIKFAKILTSMFGKNMPGMTFDLTVICEIEKLRRIQELQRAFIANSSNISVVNPKMRLAGIDFDNEDEFDESDDQYDPENENYVDPDDLNDDIEIDEEDLADTMDTINNILGMGGYRDGGHDPLFGNYKNHNKNKKDDKSKKSYSSSRILKEADHPKRDVKRHGIIIESSDKARDRDEEIIKSFLKDFIPGSSDWVKSYRKTVLKRWLNQYSITKKTAKKIAKRNQEIMAAHNKGKGGKGNLTAENVSKATRNILKRYNAFYDTSK